MSLQRASIHVSLASMLVYAFSFVNQLLIARTFGAGVRMDAYLAGSNIPMIVNNLIGAVFVYAVVPHIVHEWNGDVAIRSKIMGLLIGCSALAAATVGIGLVIHVWPLSRADQFGSYQGEAAWAAALSWGACGVATITSLSDAVFNACKRFLFPVLAYLPAYLFTAIACFTIGRSYGGAALAGATLVGYLFVVPLRILQQREFLGRSTDFSLFRDFLRKTPYTTLAVMSLYAFPLVDTFLGPRVGEGTLSILGYSTRILSTLAVIVALGPFGVMIPEIAEHSAQQNRERFVHRSLTLFRYALTLLVPVALWIWVFRLPVVVVLLQRGQFDANASQSLSSLLLYTIPGAIFMVLSMLVVRVYLADKRIREVAAMGTANLLMYFLFSLALSPSLKLAGFGIAFFAAWAIHTVVALALLFRPDRVHVDFGSAKRFILRLSCTGAALWLLAEASRFLIPTGSRIVAIGLMAVSFVVCLAVYLGMGNLLGSHEHRRLWSIATRALKRGT